MLWLKQDFIFVPCLFKSVFIGDPLTQLWAWAGPASPLTSRLPPEVLHQLSVQKATKWGWAVHRNVHIRSLPLAQLSLAVGECRPLGRHHLGPAGACGQKRGVRGGFPPCGSNRGFARAVVGLVGLFRVAHTLTAAPLLNFGLKVLRCSRWSSGAEPELVCVCICAHVCVCVCFRSVSPITAPLHPVLHGPQLARESALS